MPPGYGSFSHNDLEEDIEDDAVQLVGSSQRPKPVLDPDIPPPSREERDYLPQERTAVRAGNPLPKPGSRKKTIPEGIRPGNKLYRTYSKKDSTKRKHGDQDLPELSAPYSVGSVKKQHRETSIMPPISVDTDDEDIMVVGEQKTNKAMMKQKGGKEPEISARTRLTDRRRQSLGISVVTREISSPSTSPQDRSKYFPVSPPKIPPRSPQENPPQKARNSEKTPAKTAHAKPNRHSSAERRLEQDVEELQAQTMGIPEGNSSAGRTKSMRRSTHGMARQSNQRDADNEDIKPTKLKGEKSNLTNKSTSSDKIVRKHNLDGIGFPLLCFQRGCGIVNKEGSEFNDLSLRLHLPPGTDSEIKVMEGEKEVEELSVMIARIDSVHVTDKTWFCLKFTYDTNKPHDQVALFTLRDEKSGANFIDALRKMDKSCSPESWDWFVEQLNFLATRRKKLEETKAQETKEKVAETLVPESQHLERRVLGVNPKVEISPRRSARKKIGTKLTPKPVEKSKRSRSLSPDPKSEQSRLTKIRKLNLPKPEWKKPLIFPFEGPKKETVDYEDLDRLNNDEFLNDNLINFYLRYLEVQLQSQNPELAKETYFLNTFFYACLTRKNENGKRNFEGVMKWTAKVDLFKTNYVIIPINESTHWYLAIICNLQHLERKLQKEKTPALPEENKSIDLEFTGTLVEETSSHPIHPECKPQKEKTPDLPEENRSMDLESTGTLVEETSSHLQKYGESNLVRQPKPVAKSNLKAEFNAAESSRHSPTDAQKVESDTEMAQTQDGLEHMILDEGEGWGKENDNDRCDLLTGDRNLVTNPKSIIEITNSPSPSPSSLFPPPPQKTKAKEKGKQKEKPPLKSKQSVPPDTPAIIILDSISYGGPSSHPSTIRNLKDYLTVEARAKRQLEVSKNDINAAYAKVPGQTNWFDCGLYLLYYVKRFLEQPKDFVAAFLAREDRKLDNELWRKEEIKGMRAELFHLIVNLHKEYESFDEKKRTEQLAARRAAKTANAGKAAAERTPPKKPADDDELIIDDGTPSISSTEVESVAGRKRLKKSVGGLAFDQKVEKSVKQNKSRKPTPQPKSLSEPLGATETASAPVDDIP